MALSAAPREVGMMLKRVRLTGKDNYAMMRFAEGERLDQPP
jgi:predicted chitinase